MASLTALETISSVIGQPMALIVALESGQIELEALKGLDLRVLMQMHRLSYGEVKDKVEKFIQLQADDFEKLCLLINHSSGQIRDYAFDAACDLALEFSQAWPLIGLAKNETERQSALAACNNVAESFSEYQRLYITSNDSSAKQAHLTHCLDQAKQFSQVQWVFEQACDELRYRALAQAFNMVDKLDAQQVVSVLQWIWQYAEEPQLRNKVMRLAHDKAVKAEDFLWIYFRTDDSMLKQEVLRQLADISSDVSELSWIANVLDPGPAKQAAWSRYTKLVLQAKQASARSSLTVALAKKPAPPKENVEDPLVTEGQVNTSPGIGTKLGNSADKEKLEIPA